MTAVWNLSGRVLVACNCDWGCPCNFNALPTTGKCEGGWTWHIDEGAYENVCLLFDGVKTKIKYGGFLQIEGDPIRNPVTGAESHPGVVLPEGIIFKRGDLGASVRFRLARDVQYDHSGKYLAVGQFHYSGSPA